MKFYSFVHVSFINMKKLFLLFLILLGGFVLYFNSSYHIKQHVWKYGDGAYLGDWIQFNENPYSIKGRTIYKDGMEIGRVVFCTPNNLTVLLKADSTEGHYHNKGDAR